MHDFILKEFLHKKGGMGYNTTLTKGYSTTLTMGYSTTLTKKQQHSNHSAPHLSMCDSGSSKCRHCTQMEVLSFWQQLSRPSFCPSMRSPVTGAVLSSRTGVPPWPVADSPTVDRGQEDFTYVNLACGPLWTEGRKTLLM